MRQWFRDRPHFARRAFYFFMPFLLFLMIAGLYLVKIDTSAQIKGAVVATNHNAALVACDTVHTSDIKLHDFLVKEFGVGDARTKRFLDDLLASDESTYKACKIAIDHLPPTVLVPVTNAK